MPKIALGVDYGTNSVRALAVDTATGEELSSAVWAYDHGDQGITLDARDPHLARQHPSSYTKGFCAAVKECLKAVPAEDVVGIGVDTTGSTPLPVDEQGVPLAFDERFADDPDAMAWLWKDHTSFAEAAEITELAAARGEPYLAKCGGTYSSEWFWSKLLHCARTAPTVFAAAHSWVECQDFVPGWLVGRQKPDDLPRGICAAGHKAMFHADWGGLPSAEFLAALDPNLAELRPRLYSAAVTADQGAGLLTEQRASESGLRAGIPVAVGAFDAHLGAVGSGVKPGRLVKIMGTSTCDILVGGPETPDIPGVCGVVPGSVIPGLMGIEAGQSAVGDLFGWFTGPFGGGTHEQLTREAEGLRPGESGLLALDWNNGNRTILVDPLLTGLLVGQTLHTTPAEAYRALIEATAFGARIIVERIAEYGVPIEDIVVCGGLAEKSPLTMQIYADVLNRPILTSRSTQTCALGAAICGSVVGGAHASVLGAIGAMTGTDREVRPDPDSARTYDRLFGLYRALHDSFGGVRAADLGGVMKELLTIRREVLA